MRITKYRPLDRIDDIDFGGKANNLFLLIQSGVPVPSGMVLKLDLSLEDSPDLAFREIIQKLNISNWREAIVRSSFNIEDGTNSAYAGIFESHRCTTTDFQNIIDAVKRTANSFKSDRLKAYQAQFLAPEKSPQEIEANVIIQKYIRPKYAGVMFTYDIISGHSSTILVEYVLGHGEDLVAGLKTPVTIKYDTVKKEVTDRFDSVDVSKSFNNKALQREFENHLIEGLVELLNNCTLEYKNKADIEWVIDENGKFYWVQARPITT